SLKQLKHSESRHGTRWTTPEFVATLDLYKTPGVYPDRRHPKVIELSRVLGRTPSAVALRLANFRSIETHGKHGMSHFPPEAKKVWENYSRRNHGPQSRSSEASS